MRTTTNASHRVRGTPQARSRCIRDISRGQSAVMHARPTLLWVSGALEQPSTTHWSPLVVPGRFPEALSTDRAALRHRRVPLCDTREAPKEVRAVTFDRLDVFLGGLAAPSRPGRLKWPFVGHYSVFVSARLRIVPIFIPKTVTNLFV